MRQTFPAVLLLACMVTLTATTQAQAVKENAPAPQNISTIAVSVVEIDLSTVQIVRPFAVADPHNPRSMQMLREQFGIPAQTQGYATHMSENPNLAYKKAYPFPEIEREGLVPSEPNGLDVTHAGLRQVTATTRYWVWPPRDRATALTPVVQTLWHWDVPAPLQKLWISAAHGKGTDRYWALCLYPAMDAKTPAIPVETHLFYFDTLHGLKWQTTIPVRQMLPAASPADSYGSPYVQLGITSDGNRLLALVSRPDKNMSLLYVFDGQGKLLRMTPFPSYTAQQSGLPSWQLLRSSTGQTHVIVLRYNFDSNKDVSLLVDAEGNIVTRFEDEAGRAVHIRQVTNKYAVALARQADGQLEECILKLP
jgi:hypothetical protein